MAVGLIYGNSESSKSKPIKENRWLTIQESSAMVKLVGFCQFLERPAGTYFNFTRIFPIEIESLQKFNIIICERI